MPRAAAMLVKECVNRTQETSLSEGVRFERRAIHALFGTEDQKEGMAAFVESGSPSSRAADQAAPATSLMARSVASGSATPLPAMSNALPCPVDEKITPPPIDNADATRPASSLIGMWP